MRARPLAILPLSLILANSTKTFSVAHSIKFSLSSAIRAWLALLSVEPGLRHNRLVGGLALADKNLAPLPDPPLGVELFGSAASFTNTQVLAIKYPVVCFVLAFVEAGWPRLCIHFLLSI